MKIRKYQSGKTLYPGLYTGDIKLQTPNLLKSTPKISESLFPVPQLTKPNVNIPYSAQTPSQRVLSRAQQNMAAQNNYTFDTPFGTQGNGGSQQTGTSQVPAEQTPGGGNGGGDTPTIGDTNLGRAMGNIFSSGLNSAGNTIINNAIKGSSFFQGLEKDTLGSIAGATAGLGANLIGQGIDSIGGHSMLSRGIGQGVATGLGTVGGVATENLLKTGSVGKLFGTGANAINPYALGISMIGTGLGAAMGPSKEYGGKYGNVTKTMDTIYDAATVAANGIPGAGQLISAGMALNKGLSNVFGSTDGMTVQDSILGSAFMPAPVKWLNMWGSSKTGSFNNQSWQNSEKVNTFMGNAFGDLGDRFDQAREEAGKTYGTFSQGAKKRAQKNINFANDAWGKVLAMADQNELQNIRSQYMSSINNQRYAQMIQGGWSPIARGKQGMKIFNNEINHNIGQRLLSGAALIDNKAMILCAGTN